MRSTTSRCRAGIVKARDAFGDGFSIREREHLPEPYLRLVGSWRRLAGALSYKVRRRLSQQAGRLAVRVLQNLTAGRVGCFAADLRQRHRPCVDKRRVAARVTQDDRVVRRNAVERFVRRKPADVGLRAAPSTCPDATRGPQSIARVWLSRPPPPPSRQPPPSWCVAEIDAHLIFTETREMPVPFDETGHRDVAIEVDDARPPADVRRRRPQRTRSRRSCPRVPPAPAPRASTGRA